MLSSTEMVTLILVRHGETAWNAEKRLQGSYDIPISRYGEQSTQRIEPTIRALKPEGAVTSDLSRARETAAILGFHDALVDPRWREAEFGDWTGKSKAVLREEGDGHYGGWREGHYTPPSAESWDQLYRRVKEALQSLIEEGGRRLIVTHSGPIRAAMACLFGLEPASLAPVNPASVTVVSVDTRPRLRAYNVTSCAGSTLSDVTE